QLAEERVREFGGSGQLYERESLRQPQLADARAEQC
ncbi:MAG: hypothetical protein JWN36_1180, partial [Microbacteriaceae bacterium]|nr:hypothetical protein [Microbacteriaceae bacterium]